jgi:hypothetical protein
MMDDYEYYRSRLTTPTVYVPSRTTSYTSRQVTMAATAVITLRTLGSQTALEKGLNAMLARDPWFYDRVMERVAEMMIQWYK